MEATRTIILQIADIDLEVGTMKGGLKTDAGKNSIVPIFSMMQMGSREHT